MSEEDYLEGVKMVERANLTLKRKNIEQYMHLLARNWMQVKNSDTIFAIGTLKNKKIVSGGTGWACVMGIDSGKDVYVFDQVNNKWYYWDYSDNKYLVCVTPILTQNYAGIGSREITENGIDAIRNVYEKTLKTNINKQWDKLENSGLDEPLTSWD